MSEHQSKDPLQVLENLVKTHFGELAVLMTLSSDQIPYVSIWQQPSEVPNSGCVMRFLPMFYVIGFVEKNRKLTLKLITFHGKVLDELNESNSTLKEDEQINFVGRLTHMQLCQGVNKLDNNLKLDTETFTFLYLVEQLEENVIVRSRKCQFVLYNESSICEMCSSLSKHGVDSYKDQCKIDDQDNVYEQIVGETYDISNCDIKAVLLQGEKNYTAEEENKIGCLINDDCIGYEFAAERQVFDLSQNIHPEESKNVPLNKPKLAKRSKTCEYCSFIACTSRALIRHIQITHKDVKYFKCKLCTFECKFKKALIEHLCEVHNEVTKSTSKTHKCKLCSYVAEKRSSLTRHATAVHEKVKPFNCGSCVYRTVSKHKLAEHINAVHNKVKRFLCDFCTYDTAIKGNLSRHIRDVHEGIRLFKCEQCVFEASQKVHLTSHIRSVHEQGPLEKTKPFQCDQCSYRFSQKCVLTNHIKTVHEKIKPFLCDFCTFSTATKHLLRQHIEVIHEKTKRFKCNQCSYEASRKHYLDEHIRSIHENIKRFQCKTCAFQTALKCNLTNHILAVHEKRKPFKCKQCIFESFRKKYLTQHIASVHAVT